MNRYTPELEAELRAFYQSLSERDRRRYAAIEARKLGYGGHSYIATVLGCERHTVATGIEELRAPTALEQPGIRQSGGGRKPSLEIIPDLEATFLKVRSCSHRRFADRRTDQMDESDPARNRHRPQATRHHGERDSSQTTPVQARLPSAQGAKARGDRPRRAPR